MLRNRSNPDTVVYQWRNVPCSDGYSPAQLLFGRRQRTSLPLLPLQNRPISFQDAAFSKDKLHSISKQFHDQHKIEMSLLHPGQNVLIQDPKTSLWSSTGTIISIRPDKLSYDVLIADRQFLRPRRLLRPMPTDFSSPCPTSTPDQISSAAPRRSPRLQSCASASTIHTPTPPSTQSSSPPSI